MQLLSTADLTDNNQNYCFGQWSQKYYDLKTLNDCQHDSWTIINVILVRNVLYLISHMVCKQHLDI